MQPSEVKHLSSYGIEIKRDFESSGERNQKKVQITKFKFSNQV